MLLKKTGISIIINFYSDDDDFGESLMIKRDIEEDVEQKKSTLKIMPEPPKEPEPVPVQPKIEERLENIPQEFLVKSEQNKIKKREKMKKYKDLWKDHRKVLKQLDDEEKARMNDAKKKALRIAEEVFYEDEYDDMELEKQVSTPSVDLTAGESFKINIS